MYGLWHRRLAPDRAADSGEAIRNIRAVTMDGIKNSHQIGGHGNHVHVAY